MTAALTARAFGGGPLEGDRIVRLVYSDEAGIDLKEPYAVVSAVIVDGDRQLVALERHLEKLVNKWVPETQREGFIFHATEIFNGTSRGSGKPFERNHPDWPHEKRWKIADDLAACFGKFKTTLTFGFVEKSAFPAKDTTKAQWEALEPKKKAIVVHCVAFSSMLVKVDLWLRRNTNEICMMIVEDNDQAHSMLKETQIYQQTRAAQAAKTPQERSIFPLRKVKQHPLFEPKSANSVLQLADFSAYVAKKYLMADHRYDRYFQPMVPHIIEFLAPSTKPYERRPA